MRRAAIFPFLGPATILYFVADVSSSSKHGLDAAGFAIAALATLLSCSLLGLRDPSQERGGQRVAWLGFACGASLLGLISPAASERLSLFGGETLRMSVQVAQALALAALGVLVSDLATSVPDAVLPVRLRGGVRAATYAAGVVCALLSIAALGPVLSLHGAPWIVPARLARAAISCAGVAVLLALVLRLARRSLGSTPEVLASNGWAVLALVPATLLAGLLIVAHFAGWALSPSLVRTAGAVSALALYVGHVWLIDPRRRLSAGPVLREIVAAAIAVAGVSLVALVLREHVPRSPLAFTLWIAAALCVGLGAFQGLGPIVQSVLAPARGRLI
ncbi:MAG TPA: hypothetical protein VHM19_09985, partial [Polyangiales bacterium]|nr:hypothetical protein [Polyangiales bacterium]